MSQSESPVKFKAAASLTGKRAVKVSAGTYTGAAKIAVAGVTSSPIGILQTSLATNQFGAVRMFGAHGSYEVEVKVATAISFGTLLYTNSTGQMSDATNGASAAMVAIQAAAATGDNGEIIEAVLFRQLT